MLIRFPAEYPILPHTSPLVSRSTQRDVETLPQTPSLNRMVRFRPINEVHVLSYDYTITEERACWYTCVEYNNMKKDAVDCIRQRMRGQSVNMLGLESRSLRGQQARQALQSDVQLAVRLAKGEYAKMRAYQDAGATKAAEEAAIRGQLLELETKVRDRVASLLEKREWKSDATIKHVLPTQSLGHVATTKRSRSRRKDRTVPMIYI